jgi:D-alanyl-D-alanine carboxypeptidase/D-alanyl-D-alanine-endopeptidase (penicillin-binding protein 4)
VCGFLTATGLFLLTSCAGARYRTSHASRAVHAEITRSPVFNRAFTGFVLLDPETGRTLVDTNGDKYFTPASNTKILTLATCLEVLGDSVPGMIWHEDEREISIVPTGDPTFLHPKFQHWQQIFADLKARSGLKTLTIYPRDQTLPAFGPGWAWDDADYDYSAERSFFPIYGNVKKLYAVTADSLSMAPPFWLSRLEKTRYYSEDAPWRAGESNAVTYGFHFQFDTSFEVDIPVRNVRDYLPELLRDTLKKDIRWSNPDAGMYDLRRLRYSAPLDTVLRRIMYESDNFVAEQMLLLCAGYKFGTMRQDTLIKWMLDSVLTNMPQRPRWVDGSGLSRYNLASPRDLSLVLLKLWKEQDHGRLLRLFPAVGVQGSVANWSANPGAEKPFVFAKSGSMSGVICLSGYVKTQSGKTLIFSFMNNNFTGSNRAWKQEMLRILGLVAASF